MSISKFAGGYLFLVAVVVGVNFPATVFYDDGSTGYPVWTILNWFMGLSVIIVLTVSSKNKKLLSVTQADIKKYLEINLSFYGSLMLTIWYFANWFNDWYGSTDLLMWWFITPLFVVITGACGYRMWRGSDGISAAPGTAQSAKDSRKIRPKGLQRLLHFAIFFNIYMSAQVGLYFILTPFFDDGSTGFPIWGVLNYFMALNVIIAFADSLKSKLQLNATEAELESYIAVNTLFYALIVLAILFFANWFFTMLASGEGFMWWFIDGLFVAAIGCSGYRMWYRQRRLLLAASECENSANSNSANKRSSHSD